MLRLWLCVSLMVAPLPAVAAPKPSPQAASSEGGCKARTKKRSNFLGSVLGTLASNVAGRSSVLGGVISVNMFTTQLTDAIACRLDKKEQKQAAEATEAAVTRGVGTTETWSSDSREGVSGSSTTQSATKLADGTRCMIVKDVIIVDGEETKSDKKMCRKPGASGYTVAV